MLLQQLAAAAGTSGPAASRRRHGCHGQRHLCLSPVEPSSCLTVAGSAASRSWQQTRRRRRHWPHSCAARSNSMSQAWWWCRPTQTAPPMCHSHVSGRGCQTLSCTPRPAAYLCCWGGCQLYSMCQGRRSDLRGFSTQMQHLILHVVCNAAVGTLGGDTVPSTPNRQTTPDGTAAQTTPLGTATQTPSGISLRAAGAKPLPRKMHTHPPIISMLMRRTCAA